MKIHFIGIGGIGMSALAGISVKRGHDVSGSDKEKTKITEELEKLGAKINYVHKKENINSNIDLVVRTSAVDDKNPEIAEARRKKIKIKDRSDFLAELMANKKAIAVSGTHGKTTISAMISAILLKAKKDPTIAIGGLLPEINHKNWRNGKGEFMVVEACEYKSSFLKLKPYITVISNIEAEHLDYFKNLNHIKKDFEAFLRLTSDKGFAVINIDNVNTQELVEKEYNFKIFTYGASEGTAEWQIRNIQELDKETIFDVYKNEQKIDTFTLKIPGEHSVLNALSAIITTAEIGINIGAIKSALEDFRGASRRMEVLGEKNGVLVIDDYGHHPTEIKTTLKALKSFYSSRGKMWCVFQPHQYSRTKLLFNDFIKSLDIPDTVIIPEIYKVRDSEEDIKSVNADKLVVALKKNRINAIYIPEFKEIAKYLKENTKSGDFVVTMGAGPVNKVGDMFLKK
jgi:UDP-N-acetylmuramate--alanine ligase